MADRAVRKTGKNPEGDITRLCNEGDAWSPRSKADAIYDIENGIHTYYVPWTDGRTEIRVVNDRVKGKYLRTDRDNTTRTTSMICPTVRSGRKAATHAVRRRLFCTAALY